MLDVSMQSNPRQVEEGKSIEQIKKRLSFTAAENNKFVMPL
jgi:hypothetical protein